MNGYFKNLSDLLPAQLEGRKRNKIDILIQASKYIKELQSRTDELIHSQASDVYSKKIMNFINFCDCDLEFVLF